MTGSITYVVFNYWTIILFGLTVEYQYLISPYGTKYTLLYCYLLLRVLNATTVHRYRTLSEPTLFGAKQIHTAEKTNYQGTNRGTASRKYNYSVYHFICTGST